MFNQKILPVIPNWKQFEAFLKSDMTWCVFMDFHINFMEELFKQLHAHQKKGIVHMDLVKGIQNDAFGAQFMCQRVHVDGIISTKPKTVEAAKVNHVVAILRVFLIDSRSLKRSALMAEALQPDYMEVLPGVIPHTVDMVRTFSRIPLIGGGLIKTQQDVDNCFAQGMSVITTSSWELCKQGNTK